jgi:hypothetical protein
MSETPRSDLAPLLCARCATELTPGAGTFFEVQIQAVADPSPPELPAWDLATVRQEIARTLHELRDVSPQEAMDQVFRRLTIHLCNRCYRSWIEDPAGQT